MTSIAKLKKSDRELQKCIIKLFNLKAVKPWGSTSSTPMCCENILNFKGFVSSPSLDPETKQNKQENNQNPVRHIDCFMTEQHKHKWLILIENQ